MASDKIGQLIAGEWIGATQGHPAPAHLWSIAVRGTRLTISTRWEGQQTMTRLSAQLLADGFLINGGFRALILGPQHFVIPGWDTNDTRDGQGEPYDVIFSRPGLAELATPAAYRRYLSTARGA
jgi:hypothetical protein